ncbi:MAG: zinc ribbon domain-containing protein [Anaerolineales bacterium]|nr:zinc ribbon domain-containing protein [Anaerolineales bacterium]
MDIGSILVALGLLAVVAAYLTRPLVERRGQSESEESHQVSILLAERDRVLSALQDLDMDHSMGKVSDEHYTRQRRELVQQGARILRRLDDEYGQSDEPAVESMSSLASEIEAEVEALRQTRPDQAETSFCPACGERIQEADRYCTHCGEPLTEEVGS